MAVTMQRSAQDKANRKKAASDGVADGGRDVERMVILAAMIGARIPYAINTKSAITSGGLSS